MYRIESDEWRNIQITDGPALPRRLVSNGPFPTKEAAFDEFQQKLELDA